MDSVQQVGLATAVRPHDAVDVVVERECGFGVAFEIGELEGSSVHIIGFEGYKVKRLRG